jgi:hypothetical protein
MVAVLRIEDVYLDSAQQVQTLSAYRSKKCQLGLLLRNPSPMRTAAANVCCSARRSARGDAVSATASMI